MTLSFPGRALGGATCALLLLASPSPAPCARKPRSIRAKILHVLDGDTVLIKRRRHAVRRVRLQGIDAPEKGQAYGKEARDEARRLAQGAMATVRVFGTDRYNRYLGEIVLPGGRDLGAILVEQGLAWRYPSYLGKKRNRRKRAQASLAMKRRDKRLRLLQRKARRAHRGLWSKRRPEPPWRWRALRRWRSRKRRKGKSRGRRRRS